MRWTVIGCAGSFPGPASACSCYLVEHDGFRLLIDIGNGALGALQNFCDPRDVDAVVVSHLHGDHWLDLVPLAYARPHHPDGRVPPSLPVLLPDPQPLYVLTGKDAAALRPVFDVRPIVDGEVGPFSVTFIPTVHPVNTYAMRIRVGGISIGYTADTAWSDRLAPFFSGVDLLVAEATFPARENGPPGLHLTAVEAAELANRSGAGRLLLTHIPPWLDPQVQYADAVATFTGRVDLARPGWSVRLD